MQIEAFLENSALRLHDKTALICGDRRLSYGQLDEQCNQIANGLVQIGVRRGDRVAVCLHNSVETVVSMFAILKAGAVFTIVSPATMAQNLNFTLSNSGAKVLITDRHKTSAIQSYLDHLHDLETIVLGGNGGQQIENTSKSVVAWDTFFSDHSQQLQAPPKYGIDLDVAALIYTSGSTGNPKGVMMTHLNMVAAASSVTTYLQSTEDDVILNVLPLSSSYGLYQVLMTFKVGGTLVLERSFTYPRVVLQRLMDEHVTGFPIVPTVAAILLQMDLSSYRLPELRYITNAGAALPTAHIQRLQEVFPTTRLYLMYGLTECKRVSYLPPDEVNCRPNSVGKPIPNVEAYVVNQNGDRLPPGEVGELVVRGSNVMKGYWNLPQETAKALKPGPIPGEYVLHTGDLFRMDAEGYLYWIGRMDDIIKSRGEKVCPKDVEDVLYRLEGVAMVVVIGVPDELLGQAIKAVITLKTNAHLTKNDVLRHCARHLEDFMIPTCVEFRESLPKTSGGKVDRRGLAHRMESTT